MFEWLKHIITAILGEIIGSSIIKKAEETKKNAVGEALGKATKERMGKWLDENHREFFFRIKETIDPAYQSIIENRLLEATRFGKENYMVNLIGRLLESAPIEQQKFLLEQFALKSHVNYLTNEELKKEWQEPKKSEFLLALYTLEDDKILQFFIRAKDIVKDLEFVTVPEIKKINNDLEDWLTNHATKKGYIHKPR